MRVRVDQRGVAIQVGAALLLAFLVVAISLYQTQVVPSENRQIELEHNQELHAQLGDLRNAVVSVPGGGTGRSVSVTLGTDYPYRTLFLNPPPAGGQLRTTGPANLTVANATATDAETRQFWTGGVRNVTTRALVYRVDYNQYGQAPDTLYENTVVFDAYDDGADVARTEQALIDGRTITLVALNGTYQSAGSSTVSVDLRAASTSTRVVTVRNRTSNVTLAVPTRMNESEWQRLLDDEMGPGGNVSGVSVVSGDPFDRLVVDLEPGTYRLRMAKVGVGSAVSTEQAAYLTDVAGDGESVTAGSNQTLTVEARDRFNNPVAGTRLEANVTSGPGSVVPANDTADSEGQATFVYQAPDSVSSSTTATVAVNISGPGSPSDAEQVTFEVTVEPVGGGNGSDGAYGVDWTEGTAESGKIDCDASLTSCTLNATGTPAAIATLTMATTPTADGALVQYAVDNTSVGALRRATGTTNSSGENTTELVAVENGTVSVYTSSGGSGDVVEVTVEGISGSSQLITAVSPNPVKIDNQPGEFVRVSFATPTNVSNWKLYDDDGSIQNTTFPDDTVSGDVYFARKPEKFSEVWSVDNSTVYPLATKLNDNGEHLRLADDSGDVVDEFGYNGTTTSNGWTVDIPEGSVGYRDRVQGVYLDTNQGSDWNATDEHVFFNVQDRTRPSPGVGFFDTGSSSSKSYLESIDANGTVGFYEVDSLTGLGPMEADLDGDGLKELPYITTDPDTGNGVLKAIDVRGEKTELVSSGDIKKGIRTSNVRIGVGDVNENGKPEVYFPDNNNNIIYAKEIGGPMWQVNYTTGNGNNGKRKPAKGYAIAGTADFNGDGDQDLVYGTTDPEIAYIDNSSRTKPGVDMSGDTAIGGVANYDGSGLPEVAYVNSNTEVGIVGKDGTKTELTDTGGNVKATSMASLDVNADPTPEIVFVNGNSNSELYYANATAASIPDQWVLKDEFGYEQKSGTSPGPA